MATKKVCDICGAEIPRWLNSCKTVRCKVKVKFIRDEYIMGQRRVTTYDLCDSCMNEIGDSIRTRIAYEKAGAKE